jgi:general secretion pathway protein G
VTVAVLAGLASFTFYAITRDVRTPARSTTATAGIVTLGVALEVFRNDVGRFPTASEGLDALANPPPGLAGWNGPYFDPGGGGRRDPWGHDFVYKRVPTPVGDSFRVVSVGADGKAGTSDDMSSDGL